MTPTPEPRDPDNPKTGGGRARETSFANGRQELGEPAKKGRPAARAISSREARRRTEILRLLTVAWRCVLAMEKP